MTMKRGWPFPNKGTRNPSAKLTEAAVRAIRAAGAADNAAAIALAAQYGVTRATIYNILSRRIWPHVV